MANQRGWHCLSNILECDLLKDPSVLIKIRCNVFKALSKLTKDSSCVCATSLLHSSHDSETPRVLLLLSLRVLSLTFFCHMMCTHPFLVLGFHAVRGWSRVRRDPFWLHWVQRQKLMWDQHVFLNNMTLQRHGKSMCDCTVFIYYIVRKKKCSLLKG